MSSRRPPFTPRQLPALAVWVEALFAEDPTPGSGVGRVKNRGSLGDAADFLASGGAQPAYETGIFGSLPGLHFDGSSDYLKVATPFLVGQTGSIFMVVKFDVVNITQNIFASADQASTTRIVDALMVNNQFFIAQRNNDTQDSVRAAENLSAGVNYLLEVHSDGLDYYLSVNGRSQAAVVAGGSNSGDWFGDVPAADNVTFGAAENSGGAGGFFDGYLGALVVSEVLNSYGPLIRVREYLARRYNVAIG